MSTRELFKASTIVNTCGLSETEAAYVSTGTDPQFIIETPFQLNKGWHEFCLTADIANRANPKLYFDFGNGFQEDHSANFFPEGQQRYRTLVHVDVPVQRFRLDPSESTGTISIRSLSARRFTSAEIIMRSVVDFVGKTFRRQPIGAHAVLRGTKGFASVNPSSVQFSAGNPSQIGNDAKSQIGAASLRSTTRPDLADARETLVREFDAEYYLSVNPDVAQAGIDPILHYLESGWREGRDPHPEFQTSYYLLHNEDIAKSGENPFLHYVMHGRAENRVAQPFDKFMRFAKNKNIFDDGFYAAQIDRNIENTKDLARHYYYVGSRTGMMPNRHFDAKKYAILYPELDDNTHFLEHYYNHPDDNLYNSALVTFPSRSSQPVSKKETRSRPRVIDVIIPVYDGLIETQRAIDSVLRSHNDALVNLIVFFDAGPDERIRDYLVKLRQDNPDAITLELNPQNLGFVRTVNQAFRLCSNDVVILNADTEVSDYWLDRIIWHADNNPSVGTVTPFSNNATICNFPSLAGFSEIPEFTSAGEISDQLYACNKHLSISLPTGVGSCMYISQEMLNIVGYFDEESFGLGYGEENDLCRRGEKHGFSNLHALDVFIFHQGEVSFKSVDSKKEIREANLVAKHPEYNAEVAAAFKFDWARRARARGFLSLCQKHAQRVTVYLSLNMGGGTDIFLRTKIEKSTASAIDIILAPNSKDFALLDARAYFAGQVHEFQVGRLDLERFASQFKPGMFEVHHSIGWGSASVQALCSLWPDYRVYIHDFHWVCGRIFGVTSAGEQCGLPKNIARCLTCLACDDGETWNRNILPLRLFADSILSVAKEVVCATEFVARHISRLVPDAKTSVQTELWDQVQPVKAVAKHVPSEVKVVLILGHMSAHKGLSLVNSVAPHLEALGVNLMHLGRVYGGDFVGRSIGEYKRENLPELLNELNIDVIWIPSLAEETYSFTLSEALNTPFPVIVNDVGALPERVAGHEACLILDHRQSAEQIATQIIAVSKWQNHKQQEEPVLDEIVA